MTVQRDGAIKWQWRYLQSVKTLSLFIQNVSPNVVGKETVYVLVQEGNKIVTKPVSECSKGFGFVSEPIVIPSPSLRDSIIPIDTLEVPSCAFTDFGLTLTFHAVSLSIPPQTVSKPTDIQCKRCQSDLKSPSNLIFKESPSEHWAELVDCWSCHKQEFASVGKDLVDSSIIIPRDSKTIIYNQNGYVLTNQDANVSFDSERVTCTNCGYLLGSMVNHSASFIPITRTFNSKLTVQNYIAMRMTDLLNAHSSFVFCINGQKTIRLLNWTCAVSAVNDCLLEQALIVQLVDNEQSESAEHLDLIPDEFDSFINSLGNQQMLTGMLHFIKS